MAAVIKNKPPPCPCLISMLIDDRAGARAFCGTHHLFGMKLASGKVIVTRSTVEQRDERATRAF